MKDRGGILLEAFFRTEIPITTEEQESMGALLHPGKYSPEGCLPGRTGPLLRDKTNLFGSPGPGPAGLDKSIFITELKLAGIVRSGKTYK